MAPKIWESKEWAALTAHAKGTIAESHLRELMLVRMAPVSHLFSLAVVSSGARELILSIVYIVGDAPLWGEANAARRNPPLTLDLDLWASCTISLRF